MVLMMMMTVTITMDVDDDDYDDADDDDDNDDFGDDDEDDKDDDDDDGVDDDDDDDDGDDNDDVDDDDDDDDDDVDDDDDGPRADGGWRQPLPRIPSWRKGGLRFHVEKWMWAEANFALDLWKTWSSTLPFLALCENMFETFWNIKEYVEDVIWFNPIP